jgi:hypothetical protein
MEGRMAKQMEGDNRERRKLAREAQRKGKKPSEVGATLGASKQRAEAGDDITHQQKIDQQRQGKQRVLTENTPQAKPRSRDPETPDQQRHPKL